jgi:hypothetical protein
MSEEWDIMDLAKEIPVLVSANELPDTFEARIIDASVRTDKQGRKSLYLRLELEDGKITVMKYTPMHIAELIKFMAKMGIKTKDDLVGKKYQFKKVAFRIGFPRPMPVKVIEK